MRTDPRELSEQSGEPTCATPEQACDAEDLVEALPEQLQAGATDLAEPTRVTLDVQRLQPLYAGDLGDRFILACSPRIRATLDLRNSTNVPVLELAWNHPEDRIELIETMRSLRAQGLTASVLWIGETEFEHYLPEHVEGMKLGAISFFSVDYTPALLQSYLDILYNTDYHGELRREQHLLEELEAAERLVLETPEFGTTATFQHLETDFWFSLHGPLRPGDQTVLPTGELSTLADDNGDFSDRSHLPLNGRIVFHGSPIIHRGGTDVPGDAADALFTRLAAMQYKPVIAEVDNGFIDRFIAPTEESRRLADTFTELVRNEPRYRKIHEFGFGTHDLVRNRLPVNFHPNERWPGIHLGLGLGGYTPFHIDLALEKVRITTVQSSTTSDLYRTLGLTPA